MFSFYASASDTLSQEIMSIEQYVCAVRQGTFARDKIKNIRELKDREEKEKISLKSEISEIAQTMPRITPHGVFSRRNDACIKTYSGFACIEFDDLTQTEAQICIDELANDEYVAILHRTKSNRGVAAFVRIETGKFYEAYLSLSMYFAAKGWRCDRSAGAISKTRDFSYDSNIIVNEASKVFKKYVKIDKKANRTYIHDDSNFKRLVGETDLHRINITETYQEYMMCAYAICSEYKEAGLSYFLTFARQSASFKESHATKLYYDCIKTDRREKSRVVTISWLYSQLKKAGREIYSPDVQQKIKTAMSYINQKVDDASIDKNASECGVDSKFVSEIRSNMPEARKAVNEDMTSESKIMAYIERNYESVYFNKMDGQTYINGRPMEERDTNTIYHGIERDFGKPIGHTIIESLLHSEVIPEYDPIEAMIADAMTTESKYDKQPKAVFDEIAKSFWSQEDLNAGRQCPETQKRYSLFFEKWYLGLIENLTGERHDCPLVLWFHGIKTGVGKSSCARGLLPDKYRFLQADKENVFQENTSEREVNRWLMSYAVTIMDEMDPMTEEHLRRFKNITARPNVSTRLYFEKHDTNKRRYSMFSASSNDEVVVDDPKNRRVLGIYAAHIDFDIWNSIDKFWLIKAAIQLTKIGCSHMFKTKEENDALNFNNKKIGFVGVGEETILSNFSTKNNEDKTLYGMRISATDMIILVGRMTSNARIVSMSPQKITVVLNKNGYACEKVKNTRSGHMLNLFYVYCDQYTKKVAMESLHGGLADESRYIFEYPEEKKTDIKVYELQPNTGFDAEAKPYKPAEDKQYKPAVNSDILPDNEDDYLPF